MTKVCRMLLVGFALLGALAGCEESPPPASPSPTRAAASPATTGPSSASAAASPEEHDAATPVPPGALDIPGGGCPAGGEDPDSTCVAARALPVALTRIPTKLDGLLPLPGGKVKNQSTRDIYAIGSLPGPGSWEIVRVPAGTSVGGDLRAEARETTTDADWVSATPPTPDARGGFTYDPSAIGVKIVDGGELTVVDRPGGGVRFWLSSGGSLPSKITSAGQMNGGQPIVYVPRR